MITAVIPAHNEAEALPATVASLRAQTVAPELILVVSDNSTDATVAVARDLGVGVLETENNTARKAGALNQALQSLQDLLRPQDLVLVMDADTELDPRFIERALAELADPEVGAVGAVFAGENPRGYLQLCQHLEWARYAEQIDRTGKVFVLSGTAALIRWEALEDVRRASGSWYNEATITEDMRLTMELKTAGWRLRSPIECRSTTEMMPTVRMLWLQRRRWYLGALQNVADMGWTRVTRPYIRQQVILGLVVALLWSLLISMAVSAALFGISAPVPYWLAAGAVFVTLQVVTVWDEPRRYRLFAALMLPELLYALILQTAYLAAVYQKIRGREGTWAHLPAQKESTHVR